MKDNSEMTREELIALGWLKKQSTAVEFLEQELDKNFEIRGNSFLFDKILKQAKEMERQQIMNAWNNGFEDNRPYVDHSEDYYNETYNKK